jgi:predicted aspartyl protease
MIRNYNQKKMKSSVLLILTGLMLMTSCGILKQVKFITKGRVAQKEFVVKVPFEYRFGLIVIKVSIDGKEYDFIFDTGSAYNVISEELAEKLGIESDSKNKIVDSQGQSSKLSRVTIGKANIGGINFLNTGAVVSNLKPLNEIGCFRIDGLIGANLMRKAVWKIDVVNQILTITNSVDSLDIPESNYKIHFNPTLPGNPFIDIKLNNLVIKHVEIDLGSSGDISLNEDDLRKLLKSDSSISHIFSYGISSFGLYGISKFDSIYYAVVNDFTMGDVSFKNTIVSFKKNGLSTIGNKLFKNFDLILDWSAKEITMIQKKNYEYSSLSAFGFSYTTKENKLFVVQLFEKSQAYKDGLRLDDQIIKVGETSYDTISFEQWCSIAENGLFGKDDTEITIKVLRDTKELTFNLKKEKLL